MEDNILKILSFAWNMDNVVCGINKNICKPFYYLFCIHKKKITISNLLPAKSYPDKNDLVVVSFLSANICSNWDSKKVQR